MTARRLLLGVVLVACAAGAVAAAWYAFVPIDDPGNAEADSRVLACARTMVVRPEGSAWSLELTAEERLRVASEAARVEGNHWPCNSPFRFLRVDGRLAEWGSPENRADAALQRVHPEFVKAARLLHSLERYAAVQAAPEATAQSLSGCFVPREGEALRAKGTNGMIAEVRALVAAGDEAVLWSPAEGGFARGRATRPLFARFRREP